MRMIWNSPFEVMCIADGPTQRLLGVKCGHTYRAVKSESSEKYYSEKYYYVEVSKGAVLLVPAHWFKVVNTKTFKYKLSQALKRTS